MTIRSLPAAGIVAVALGATALAGCGGGSSGSARPGVAATASATTPAAPASTGPIRGHEPNDHAAQANGPLTAAGILLGSNVPGSVDYDYFKLKPKRSITLSVTHLSGRCGNGYVQTRMPGQPGKGSGGQDQTAVAPDAPVIDTNGNQDTSIGDTPGTVLTLKTGVDDENSPSGIVGVLVNYGGGDDDNADNCRLRITLAPADALITERAAGDAAVLADPDMEAG